MLMFYLTAYSNDYETCSDQLINQNDAYLIHKSPIKDVTKLNN